MDFDQKTEFFGICFLNTHHRLGSSVLKIYTNFFQEISPRMFGYVQALIYVSLWETKLNVTYSFKITGHGGKKTDYVTLDHTQFMAIVNFFEFTGQGIFESFVDEGTVSSCWWWKFYRSERTTTVRDRAKDSEKTRNFIYIYFKFYYLNCLTF